MKPRAIVSWSGGKDAAWALRESRRYFEITAIFTSVSDSDDVVPIHNTPSAVIDEQAAALNLPAWKVAIPQPCPNAEYLARMNAIWLRAKAEGVTHVIFGDLFLADIREFREQMLQGTGLTPVFPLWNRNTLVLAEEMLAAGVDATVCAVDSNVLPAVLIGRKWDAEFLRELPPSADPCGENGEFHTVVKL